MFLPCEQGGYVVRTCECTQVEGAHQPLRVPVQGSLPVVIPGRHAPDGGVLRQKRRGLLPAHTPPLLVSSDVHTKGTTTARQCRQASRQAAIPRTHQGQPKICSMAQGVHAWNRVRKSGLNIMSSSTMMTWLCPLSRNTLSRPHL